MHTVTHKKGFIKMSKIIVKLCIATALFTFASILNAEDGSEGSPFSNIGHAHYVPEPGVYHFKIGEGGTPFSSYVDKDGWVLVAAANKDTATRKEYSEVNAIKLDSDQILSKDIRAGIAGITELRMSATQGPATPFDVTTAEKLAIDNFYADKTLSKGDLAVNKGSKWAGTGTERTKFVCNSVSGVLKKNIYHACGNGQGLHWNPVNGQERIDYSPGNNINDLRLWVRGAAVEPPSGGMLMWVLLILGLVAVVVVVVVMKKGKSG